MKTSDWLTIIAIVVGPLFAVLTQLLFQTVKTKHDQKLWVFSTLMGNRGATLSQPFVTALNYIDVVFYKNESVRSRWKTLLDLLASDAYRETPVTQATIERTRDLTAELLAEIAKDMHFEYDHTHIKENAYYPKRELCSDW